MSNLIKFANKLKKKLAQEVEEPVNPAKDPAMEALYRKLDAQSRTIELLGRNLSNAINTINRISEEGHATDKSLSIEFYKDAMNRLQQSLPLLDVAKEQMPGAIQTLNQMVQTLQKKNKA